MDMLTNFNYKGIKIRIQRDEAREPLFSLADVCRALDDNPNKVADAIREEFNISMLKEGRVVFSDGSSMETSFITEPQLYFVMMRSRSEFARPFRQWAVNEMLPTIHKELAPKSKVEGFRIYYKNPATGQIIKGRLFTKYEELESKYDAQRDINKRLLHRAATQKSENAILRGKVNDLDHKLRQACQERVKLSQACQERDKLAEKLYRAEVEVQRYGLLLKKLSHLIYEETRC